VYPHVIDDSVDRVIPFHTHFRDFSVRNLNPSEYFASGATELEGDIWQTDFPDFSMGPHTSELVGPIGLATQDVFVEVEPLAAEVDQFTLQSVRQVTIDVASLTNAGSADIDVIGRVALGAEGQPPTWSRVRGAGSSLTFCRDTPSQDFDLIYVVLSNHARTRGALGGADADAALSGSYTITTKDHCDVPIAYEGTFGGTQDIPTLQRWQGSARFELVATVDSCDSGQPPTADSVEYCYRFVGGELTWTAEAWTDLAGLCRFTPTDSVHVELTPDPFPMLRIVGRTLDSRLVNWYYVLERNEEGFPMEVPDGTPLTEPPASCTGPTLFLNTWLYTPRDNYRSGWELSGSQTLDHQSFSWNLHPVFASSG
jgi:hypothetical protein